MEANTLDTMKSTGEANTLAAMKPNSDGNTILRLNGLGQNLNRITIATLQDKHIMAVVRNNQKQIYLPILKEDVIFLISNFKLVPGPKQYKSIDAEHSIIFYYKTKIAKSPDTNVIPHYKFELIPFSDIKKLVGNINMLIDVIGLVKTYGQIERRNNRAQKMDVLLTDSSLSSHFQANSSQNLCYSHMSENIVLTLREDRAKQFVILLPACKGDPVFVVVTGLLAKKFSAEASLSSTDATRYYINIDYAPLTCLKDELAVITNNKTEPLPPPKIEHFVTPTGESIPELSISSILETLIPPGTLAMRCICHAKIISILDGNRWYYNCCPTCPRALRDLNGKFFCLACQEETETLAQR
ncbi:uncharacterized protein LOC141714781 [Apium graveolens]|uniref:uncharacterized protein LOC141714781 n=1 Tax=Apium graveolens TaxID=4045 RepID=UPI003D797957